MAYLILFVFLFKGSVIINDIGEALKSTRVSSGVSLEETSKDLNIPVLSLTQIEDGNIGAFKDIFELKEMLINYSKYLGLNSDDVIDEFNEYLFERTSMIPLKEIEKSAKEQVDDDDEIASPYTRSLPIDNTKKFVITIVVVIILVIIAVVWSIKQITIGNTTTNILSFFNK